MPIEYEHWMRNGTPTAPRPVGRRERTPAVRAATGNGCSADIAQSCRAEPPQPLGQQVPAPQEAWSIGWGPSPGLEARRLRLVATSRQHLMRGPMTSGCEVPGDDMSPHDSMLPRHSPRRLLPLSTRSLPIRSLPTDATIRQREFPATGSGPAVEPARRRDGSYPHPFHPVSRPVAGTGRDSELVGPAQATGGKD